MYVISELREKYEEYGLPRKFVMCLPIKCPDCGADLVMSETLTGLKCSNFRCRSKMVMRIRAICKDLNILSFGESTIEKFIDYYKPTNPLDIFALQEGMIIGEGISHEVSDKIISQIRSKNHFLLWEFVQMANIEGVRTSARNIFQGYECLADAYRDIESGGIDFICKKLGIPQSDELVSLRASKILKSLMDNKEDLLEGEGYVVIEKLNGMKELNVVCSDQVGGRFKNKPEFYAYVKQNFGEKVHVNFLPSVNRKIDYLVWAGADGTPARYTSKVQKVENWNEKGSNIPIVTGEEFIRVLEVS